MTSKRIRLAVLRGESGIAIVAAVGVLLIVGILSAVVAAEALDLGDVSNRDRSSKRALAAAEAGFQRALAELNAAPVTTCSNPSVTDCGPTADGGSLADFATYQYWISPILNGAAGSGINANDCVGRAAVGAPIATNPSIFVPLVQRCITVEATSARVTRRVQVRVAAASKFQLFPVGLTGRRRLCIAAPSGGSTRPYSDCTVTAGAGQPNAAVISDVAADDSIVAPNIPVCGDMFALSAAYAQPDPDGQTPSRGWVLGGNCTTPWTPFTQPPDSPSEYECNPGPTCPSGRKEIEEPGFQAPPWDDNFEQTDDVAENDNAALITALQAIGCDPARVYNATARDLDLSQQGGCSGTVDLPAGSVYNFCRLNIDDVVFNSQGQAPVGDLSDFSNSVQFFIDSPYRPNSGCGGSAGGSPFDANDGRTGWRPWGGSNCNLPGGPGFKTCGDGTLEWAQQPAVAGAQGPRSLLIFVYGNPEPESGGTCAVSGLDCPPAENTVDLRNGGEIAFGMNAPWSLVQVKNSPGGANTSTNCPTYTTTQAGAVDICGAILARDLDVGNNFIFREDPFFRYLQIDILTPTYYRSSWHECTRVASGSTPTAIRAGCT